MPGAKSLKELRDKTLGKWKEDKAGNLTKKEAGSSREESGTISYTVQEGDTWNQIALDQGVPLDEMDLLNPDVSDHGKIKTGQIIIVGTTDPESLANPTDAEKRDRQDPPGLNWKANPDAPIKSRVKKSLGMFGKE